MLFNIVGEEVFAAYWMAANALGSLGHSFPQQTSGIQAHRGGQSLSWSTWCPHQKFHSKLATRPRLGWEVAKGCGTLAPPGSINSSRLPISSGAHHGGTVQQEQVKTKGSTPEPQSPLPPAVSLQRPLLTKLNIVL